MPLIQITTVIHAPAERVFNLCRSIDFHLRSMRDSREKVEAGKRTGLLQQGDKITWLARHMGKNRVLQIEITGVQPFLFFEDRMLKGDFRALRHQHFFREVENGTVMIDWFHFETPYGWWGKCLNRLVLTAYLRRLLEKRNQLLKTVAEGAEWSNYLPGDAATRSGNR